MEVLIAFVVGVLSTVAGFRMAFVRRNQNPQGKSAKFLHMLGD